MTLRARREQETREGREIAARKHLKIKIARILGIWVCDDDDGDDADDDDGDADADDGDADAGDDDGDDGGHDEQGR